MYIDKARSLQPEYDRFGMVIAETVNRGDPWESRVAIAIALQNMIPLTPNTAVTPLFDFFITREALGDRNPEVRRKMLDAAISLIDLQGAKEIAGLMKMFEDHLGQASSSETSDDIKEAVVIVSCFAVTFSLVSADTIFIAVRPTGRPLGHQRLSHTSSGRKTGRSAQHTIGIGSSCRRRLSSSTCTGYGG